MNIAEPGSVVTALNNIVDNIEQCGRQNIVQSNFHEHFSATISRSFFAGIV